MPDLNNDQLTLTLMIVAAVTLVLLLLVLALTMRLRKLRRDYVLVRGEGEDRDIIATVGRWVRQVDVLGRRLDEVTSDQEQQQQVNRFSLQRFAIVRYDAFEDMGGRLSFSAALLDDHGDGIVISSINGRTETRTYAKAVKGMDSDFNLSDEERQAISAAASGRDRSERHASAARS